MRSALPDQSTNPCRFNLESGARCQRHHVAQISYAVGQNGGHPRKPLPDSESSYPLKNVAPFVTREVNIETTISNKLLVENIASRAVAQQLANRLNSLRETEPARHHFFEENRNEVKRCKTGVVKLALPGNMYFRMLP